jgi:hypothetical protein
MKSFGAAATEAGRWADNQETENPNDWSVESSTDDVLRSSPAGRA